MDRFYHARVEAELLRWEAPGPYEVAFSTRRGGVSEGDFASLNLGLLTEDEPHHVLENRLRLARALGAAPDAVVMNWQQHGTIVRRAGPGIARADGLVTDEPGRALLVLAADCVPVALVRANGGAPALALLHAGWRGLAGGIVQRGVEALAGGVLAACVGPAIGPCCYEVGPEVAGRFDSDLVRGGRLDLPGAAERALRAAGVERVERVDLCTSCRADLFFSHRRDGGRTGRQGAVGLVA
jgi:YfiH family protein